ncbi:hypothetical protein V6N12_001441 [Hibiscus sabdariffa]|uniref:Uncharacterized protein n=1 Tax=Hibiscus sabdariffa TaxID=183260 RepID=A0ABR2BQL1_9ROSI
MNIRITPETIKGLNSTGQAPHGSALWVWNNPTSPQQGLTYQGVDQVDKSPSLAVRATHAQPYRVETHWKNLTETMGKGKRGLPWRN